MSINVELKCVLTNADFEVVERVLVDIFQLLFEPQCEISTSSNVSEVLHITGCFRETFRYEFM